MPQRRTNKRVHADTASSSPIYPPFSAGDSVEEDLEARCKRIKIWREDLEMVKLELDIQHSEQEIMEKSIRNMHAFIGLMSTIRPDWMVTNTGFRLQTEIVIKNIILSMAP